MIGKTKQLSRATGRCYRMTLLPAAAIACCGSYAVAQDTATVVPMTVLPDDGASTPSSAQIEQNAAPDAAVNADTGADTVMMLADNAASCAANPAACAVRVYAGGGNSSIGSGGTTGSRGGSPGSGGNNGNRAGGPAGVACPDAVRAFRARACCAADGSTRRVAPARHRSTRDRARRDCRARARSARPSESRIRPAAQAPRRVRRA